MLVSHDLKTPFVTPQTHVQQNAPFLVCMLLPYFECLFDLFFGEMVSILPLRSRPIPPVGNVQEGLSQQVAIFDREGFNKSIDSGYFPFTPQFFVYFLIGYVLHAINRDRQKIFGW